jgi:hypothetical protein
MTMASHFPYYPQQLCYYYAMLLTALFSNKIPQSSLSMSPLARNTPTAMFTKLQNSSAEAYDTSGIGKKET